MTKHVVTWQGCDYCRTVKLFGAYGCADCDRLIKNQKYQIPEEKKTADEAEAEKLIFQLKAKKIKCRKYDKSPKLRKPVTLDTLTH